MSMNFMTNAFDHHPELRDKIGDPLASFFRTFRIEAVLEEHPEMAWVAELIHTDERREEIRRRALRDYPSEDLWVFAYGSLMWDPAFVFSEVRRAHVPAFERRFILKDVMGGRGMPDNPGLMAALDHGAGCDGLVFRIPHDIIDVETEILWRRELVAPTYLPKFVTANVGDSSVNALTFVADHHAAQICTDITLDEQVQFLTEGHGILGTSMEYLTNIVAQFDALGIVDEDCSALLAAAQELMGRRVEPK
ncbi:gamma-glutamylcyclotransferase [Maritalea sp.]|uniref:gamma-glutamylcyclotransferase n=1 Tax=Maritalea sp. TaxID=2003361 RepID=UPI003EF9747F